MKIVLLLRCTRMSNYQTAQCCKLVYSRYAKHSCHCSFYQRIINSGLKRNLFFVIVFIELNVAATEIEDI